MGSSNSRHRVNNERVQYHNRSPKGENYPGIQQNARQDRKDRTDRKDRQDRKDQDYQKHNLHKTNDTSRKIPQMKFDLLDRSENEVIPIEQRVNKVDMSDSIIYDEPDICKICLDREYEMVAIPCGHLGLCADCCNGLWKDGESLMCPFCYKDNVEFYRIRVFDFTLLLFELSKSKPVNFQIVRNN